MKRRGFLASILALAAAPFVARAASPAFDIEIGRWDGMRFIQTRWTLFNDEWPCRVESAEPVLQYGDYLTFGHNTAPQMPDEVRAALDRRRHDLAREIGKRIFQKPTEYMWLPTVPGDRERRVAYGAVKFWL